MEFFVIFMLFMLFLIIGAGVAIQNMTVIGDSRLDLEAGNLLDTVKSSVNTAYLEGDGFSSTIFMPEKIISFSYTIQYSGNIVWVTVINRTYSSRFMTSNVSGSFVPGELIIKNVQGMVEVSP